MMDLAKGSRDEDDERAVVDGSAPFDSVRSMGAELPARDEARETDRRDDDGDADEAMSRREHEM